jgi:hypothetical protein
VRESWRLQFSQAYAALNATLLPHVFAAPLVPLHRFAKLPSLTLLPVCAPTACRVKRANAEHGLSNDQEDSTAAKAGGITCAVCLEPAKQLMSTICGVRAWNV